ncbi:MAG TPA: hypothetical protein VFS40_15120 [Gemmatimonadales bacterium]|nr:hypothetical protein [Gemmatimonadales bacterium]
MTQRHLVGVWNPSYAADAMDAHRELLLEQVRACRAGAIGEEDVYVWWGKVRSRNRWDPIPHLDEILALDRPLHADVDDPPEMHLYLTDYRSLYVAHVYEITRDDVTADEASHVPRYYLDQRLGVDCWFRLGDIRRLVADDTVRVVAELRQLHNVRYHGRPVSIYGGMVELPLIVTRPDAQRYFEPAERAQLLDGSYWVEFDAATSGVGAMERELRENLFGDAAWFALAPAARTFLATAEMVFRAQRSDATADFAPVLGPLAKAVEVECNLRLRQVLRAAPRELRLHNLEGRTVDLAECGHLSLGQWSRALRGQPALQAWLASHVDRGPWFGGVLPNIVATLAEVRNPGSHAARVPQDVARRWREQILGIGCTGLLVELGRVEPR